MRAVIALWALAILFAAAAPAMAAPAVTRIDVEGTRRIEVDAVLVKLRTQVGDEFNPAVIDEDVRAIYKTGYFDDVRVEQVESEGGVALIFVVVEKPSVKEFVFVGNKKFDEEKIGENTEFKPNTILSDAKIKDNIFKIRKMYEDEGFFMVDIDYRTEELPQNRVRVIIEITEYKKVYVKRINFIGNRAFSDEELKKKLLTKEGGTWSFLGSSGVYRPEMFMNDVQILRAHYLDHGYIGVKVGDPQVSLSPDRRSMFLTVPIEEGDQYYVGKVDIEGDLLFKKETLMELVTMKTGEVFSRSKFEQSTTALRSRYTDIGYAFAEVTADTPTNAETRVIDVIFKVNKGKLAYFEKISIEGNLSTRDKVIRRELFITEGDLYSGPGIRKSKERLMRQGYFDEVAMSTERGSHPEAVNLVIRVKERMQGNFAIGVGFSSIEDFIGTASISHNNLFGYGTKIQLNAEVSRLRKNFQFDVREQHLFDTDWIGTFGLTHSERDFFQYDRVDRAAQMALGHPLYWDIEWLVGYRYESIEIRNVQNQAANFLITQEGKTLSTSTIYTLQRNTVNSPFDPTDGSRVSASVEWASRNFGGDLEFMKYSLQGRRYVPIVWDISVMLNGEGAYGYPLDGGRLPITERYFLGGLNSVRGFRLLSLGPTEESTIPTDPNDPATTLTDVVSNIGGDKYLQGNVELLIPIVKELKIKGLIFYDIGNALPEDVWFSNDGFRQAWGFGLRWISPIGPLRFEWGYPLYKQQGERRQVFEFGIGTFF
ncbi:outer membrane protein assembly factor BamA [bacterium]|nr:outer membrane protein assembly factor BamA [bacterium]